jgi:hypothetical protein
MNWKNKNNIRKQRINIMNWQTKNTRKQREREKGGRSCDEENPDT